MSGDLSRQDVEQVLEMKFSEFENEWLRNQRMINSLQEEVENLRERLNEKEHHQTMKGQRENLDLEHAVMRAVASEIRQSRKNVAAPTDVKDRVKAKGHLKSLAATKIDELVEQDVLIEQGSGDLVFMNPDFEDIALVDDRYDQLKS